MLLYHGSNQEIKSIDLRECKPYKDFGRGFYLTTIREQAIQMARRTTRIFSGSPYVTEFEFDETICVNSSLSVKVFDSPTAGWAQFVLNNRNRRFVDFSDPNCNQDNKFDIVIGPVANDDIALLFRTFSSGHIDLEALVKGMKYRKLNDQYSFHTKIAISFLLKMGVHAYE